MSRLEFKQIQEVLLAEARASVVAPGKSQHAASAALCVPSSAADASPPVAPGGELGEFLKASEEAEVSWPDMTPEWERLMQANYECAVPYGEAQAMSVAHASLLGEPSAVDV